MVLQDKAYEATSSIKQSSAVRSTEQEYGT